MKRNTIVEKLRTILSRDTMPIFDMYNKDGVVYYTCSFYIDLPDNVEITLESRSIWYLVEKVYLVSRCKRIMK